SKVKKYALFSCDKGFKLVGSRVRVCEKHGRQYRWDGSDATCLAINYCEQSLCFNDGSCTEEGDGYTCICPSGFTGDHCETDINDCSPDPCSPGGTCIDGVYSYTCVCKPGYTGDNCDIGIPTHFQNNDDIGKLIRMAQENILKRNEENKQARMQGKSVGSAEWIRQGQDTVNYAANRGLNTNLAKNVIIFIGDGMGLTTMSAARILRGQQLGGTGEEHQLSWDKFSHSMLAKTYSVNGQTPDSASTANAMLTGVKTSDYVIGVDEEVVPQMCDTVAGHEVDSILRWSKREGKAAGLITTTRPSHATPAAAFAHSPYRYWEGDHQVPESEETQCPDITKQLVVNNTDIEVILGGGRSYFMNENQEDPEYPLKSGFREDGRDLIQEWYDHKLSINQRPAYVWNISAFNEVDPANTDYLMGLFERKSMHNDADRISGDIAGEPSISEMTQKAIEILSKNENGFFLLVEGGLIDAEHHAGRAARALLETIALDRAVETAVNMTSENDTLILVTADHGHVMAFGGYSERGNPILGKTLSDAADGKPYTTLTY
ncbi:unnamed protein product, partial [Owenia fusiformis]